MEVMRSSLEFGCILKVESTGVPDRFYVGCERKSRDHYKIFDLSNWKDYNRVSLVGGKDQKFNSGLASFEISDIQVEMSSR